MPFVADCPPPAELEYFMLGQLDDEHSTGVELHLSSCSACQAQIATLTAEDDLVRALKQHSPQFAALSVALPMASVPENLVKLLIPQFKRIAIEFESSSDDFKDSSKVTGQSADSLVTFVPEFGRARPGTGEKQACHPRPHGAYEIQGLLGSGGMGTVLRAFDSRLQRQVAIKVVQPNRLSEPGMRERLVREAQVAAAVEHDNIVTIHAVEELDGLPCIVMPLLRGITLKERLQAAAGPLHVAEILRIARETANGLAAAHACGLVHCDIKPANLWLEEPLGRIKILDFGLAVVHDDLTESGGGISGTPGFLAPEQAKGEAVDQRTDLFSLGCVFYEMATGKPAFTGARQLRALWTAISNKPVAAASLNPQLPEEFSDLIDCLLEREPNNRPESAAEVLIVLDAIDNRLAEQQKRIVRRRWLLAVLSAGVTSSLAVAWWSYRTPPIPPAPVPVTLVGDSTPVDILLHHDGQEQKLTLQNEQLMNLTPGDYQLRPAAAIEGRNLVPDHFSIAVGKPQTLHVALVGEVARHRTHSQAVTGVAIGPGTQAPTVFSVGLDRILVSWNPSESAPQKFVNLPHSARSLAVSKNGIRIATGGGNKRHPTELTVRFWDARQLTQIRQIDAGHSRIIQAMAFSPTGDTLASAGADGVFLWDLAADHGHHCGTSAQGGMFAIAFSPDGKQLATGDDKGQVILWNIQLKKNQHTLTSGTSIVRAVAWNASTIVAAGDDGMIRLWRESELKPRQLAGIGRPILALAMSPDGQRLITGDIDGAIRVWSIPSGQTTAVLRGHQGAVNAIAFIAAGRQAVSGGADGTVRLWQLPFP